MPKSFFETAPASTPSSPSHEQSGIKQRPKHEPTNEEMFGDVRERTKRIDAVANKRILEGLEKERALLEQIVMLEREDSLWDMLLKRSKRLKKAYDEQFREPKDVNAGHPVNYSRRLNDVRDQIDELG